MRLEGREAIEYAEANGLTLSKYNDPTEDAREGLTVDEARDVAREDPKLIYVDAIDRNHVFIDREQGTTDDERAFGFVGLRNESREYQGWFFTWPSGRATCMREQIDAVIDTLELDEVSVGAGRDGVRIPHAWAEEVLRTYLESL